MAADAPWSVVEAEDAPESVVEAVAAQLALAAGLDAPDGPAGPDGRAGQYRRTGEDPADATGRPVGAAANGTAAPAALVDDPGDATGRPVGAAAVNGTAAPAAPVDDPGDATGRPVGAAAANGTAAPAAPVDQPARADGAGPTDGTGRTAGSGPSGGAGLIDLSRAGDAGGGALDPPHFAAAAVLDVLRATGWADAAEAEQLRAEAERLRELLDMVIRDHRARTASAAGVENEQLHWLVPLLRSAHGVAFGTLGAKVALRTAIQDVPPEVLASAGLRLDQHLPDAPDPER